MKRLKQLIFSLSVTLIIPAIWLLLAIQKIRKRIAKSVLKTCQINTDILVILDGSVNMYLIKTNYGYIGIDCGNRTQNILSGLRNLQIEPEEIKAIFLTHSDSDHTGALELFPKAKVYISAAEEQIISGKARRTISKLKLPINNKLNCKYKTLEDNQTIISGNRTIKCFLTPGHTPGSMSYLIGGKYLFTGDTLALNNGQVENFIELFNMDTELEKQSIRNLKQRLSKQNIDYVFTSHFGYSNNYENAFKNWGSLP